jgi:flagellar M-ring protein FliF
VKRERVKLPGDVRKISVAVLVDGISTVAADGAVSWTARPEAELAQLSELVRSAIGFDAGRGDVVTVSSLQFSPVPVLGTEAVSGGLLALLSVNAMTLVQLGVLALVALLLGLFVLRPMLAPPAPAGTAAPAEIAGQLTGPDGQPLLAAPDAPTLAETIAAAQEILEPTPESTLRLISLREAISDKTEESVTLLRAWLETPDPGEDAA